MFSSSVRDTSLWFTTTGCSGGGCPITPSARTTLPGCRCLFRRRRPWLSVPCLLRFRAARALRETFAPVIRRQSHLERHDVSMVNPCMGWPAPRAPAACGRGPELSFHLRGGAVAGLIFLSAGRLRASACYFVWAGCIFQARIVDTNNGTQ